MRIYTATNLGKIAKPKSLVCILAAETGLYAEVGSRVMEGGFVYPASSK